MKISLKSVFFLILLLSVLNCGCVSENEQEVPIINNNSIPTATVAIEKEVQTIQIPQTENNKEIEFYNFEGINLTSGSYYKLELNEIFTNVDPVFGQGYLKKGDEFTIELISEYPVNIFVLESDKVIQTFKIQPLLWDIQHKEWDYWDGADPVFREDNVTHIQSNVSISENGFYSIAIDGRMVGHEKYPDFWYENTMNIIIKRYSEKTGDLDSNHEPSSISEITKNEESVSEQQTSYYEDSAKEHPYYVAGMLAGDGEGNVYIITSVNKESGTYNARRFCNSYDGEYYLLSDNSMGERGYHYKYEEFDKSFPELLGFALRVGIYSEPRPIGRMFAYLEIFDENKMNYVSKYYETPFTELDYSLEITYTGDLSIYKTVENKSTRDIYNINGFKKIELGKSSFIYANIKKIDDSEEDLKLVLYGNYLPLITRTISYPENEYTLFHDTSKLYPQVNDTISI